MMPRHDLNAVRGTAPVAFESSLVQRSKKVRNLMQSALCAVASLLLLFAQILGTGGAAAASTVVSQGPVVSVGILPFQIDDGKGAPQALAHKATLDLQQKLNTASKEVVVRRLSAGVAQSGTLTVEQLAAIGKQNGVQFVVRGGFLSVTAQAAGAEPKLTIQVYADVISVNAVTSNTVRAEGFGEQAVTPSAKGVRWDTIDMAAPEFSNSGPGQALASSLEQLAASIRQLIASPNVQAATEPVTEAATDAAEVAVQEVAQEEIAAAESDEELQQLIAQAESLISSGSGSVESLKALSQSLEGLKTALASKATLLEQAQDTTSAEAEVASRKEKLQAAISTLFEEVASAETSSAEAVAYEEPTGEKKGVMSRISDFLGEALNILQKIQEIRAAFRGADEESSYPVASSSDAEVEQSGTGEESAAPTEEAVEEVSGGITEDGVPVEGIDVTDVESGVTDTTDGEGTYDLPGLVSGRLRKILISKAGKQMAMMKVDMLRGRGAIADFEINSAYAKKGYAPVAKIIPSTVLVSRARSAGGKAGTLKGIIKDAQGRPVPRALVSLKGLAMARTDSRGQYLFMNVPAGNHQLSVRKSGLRLKTQQVQIAMKKSSESKVQFTPGDGIVRTAVGNRVFARGAGTVLRGVVIDADRRPVGGVKVTAVQSSAAVSVLTGAKGSYVLRELKPGPYKIVFSKVGYEGGSQTVSLRSGAPEQRDFQLKKQSSTLVERVLAARRTNPVGAKKPRAIGTMAQRTSGLPVARKGRLTGRIVEAQTGKPLQGATVSLGGQPNTQTDQNGEYAYNNLPTGGNRVSVSKAGFLMQQKTVAIRAERAAREDFALTPQTLAAGRTAITGVPTAPTKTSVNAGRLSGQVVDAKTGRPLAGAVVVVAGQQSVSTDQDGRYLFTQLVPGVYQVSVRKSGFVDAGDRLSVRAGAPIVANFRLSSRPSPAVRMKLPRI
jgi:hypothetical protein